MSEVGITLLRTAYRKNATLGVILGEAGEVICSSLERPWLMNATEVSCIPCGTYQLVPHNGTKYKGVYRLVGVPQRSAILIHAANKVSELQGCIAAGNNHATKVQGNWWIGASKKHLKLLNDYIKRNNIDSIKVANLEAGAGGFG